MHINAQEIRVNGSNNENTHQPKQWDGKGSKADRKSWKEGTKIAHMMNSLGWQTVVATPPSTIQGFTTVWPPVTDVPASSAASLKPWIISGITLSLSYTDTSLITPAKVTCQNNLNCSLTFPCLTFSDSLLLTPSNINMLSHSVTPIAYRSLKTLAHAILPWEGKEHCVCYFVLKKYYLTITLF